jgi:hypothetical protein
MINKKNKKIKKTCDKYLPLIYKKKIDCKYHIYSSLINKINLLTLVIF